MASTLARLDTAFSRAQRAKVHVQDRTQDAVPARRPRTCCPVTGQQVRGRAC